MYMDKDTGRALNAVRRQMRRLNRERNKKTERMWYMLDARCKMRDVICASSSKAELDGSKQFRPSLPAGDFLSIPSLPYSLLVQPRQRVLNPHDAEHEQLRTNT